MIFGCCSGLYFVIILHFLLLHRIDLPLQAWLLQPKLLREQNLMQLKGQPPTPELAKAAQHEMHYFEEEAARFASD